MHAVDTSAVNVRRRRRLTEAAERSLMQVTIQLPDGRFCTKCPFHSKQVKDWGMEESLEWCAYLRQEIPFDEYKQKLVKKLPDCPACGTTQSRE